MALYEDVIATAKAGEYRRALAASAAAPQIWPLLTRPLRARLARLRLSGRQKQSPLRRAPAPGV
jgi:hypothetical protein